jgi:multicomponent Na+:H+ antiporter subunit E
MLFFINFTVASVRVLLQVLNPKFSVKPGIVRLPTTLKEDTEVTIVLNSITFSPDTLAMDFEDGHMYVYWLNVTKKDVRGTAGLILRKPEKIIKGVLG